MLIRRVLCPNTPRNQLSQVVIKNMFTVEQIDADATYIIDLKTDLQSECSKFGVVKKVMVFDRHPDGVCSVKFEDATAAKKCMSKFNGRLDKQCLAVAGSTSTNPLLPRLLLCISILRSVCFFRADLPCYLEVLVAAGSCALPTYGMSGGLFRQLAKLTFSTPAPL
jgi:hypothetical protein